MRQLGLSLVELLVAIAIGSFIALAGSTYFATTFGASVSSQKAARAQEQFSNVTNAAVTEMRRAGYRGSPSQLAAYLTTTEGSGGAGSEGDFPAVDVSTAGCALFSYARPHICSGSDNNSFGVCRASDGSLSPVSTSLHYRTGLRLSSGAVEAVAVIHPDQYDAPGASSSEASGCNASGGSSAWQPITSTQDLYVDRLVFTQIGESYFDSDAGCEMSVDAGCETNVTACGDTISCRIERLYKVELCAYPQATDDLCVAGAGGSQPDGQLYAEVFVAPRNSVLISRSYP